MTTLDLPATGQIPPPSSGPAAPPSIPPPPPSGPASSFDPPPPPPAPSFDRPLRRVAIAGPLEPVGRDRFGRAFGPRPSPTGGPIGTVATPPGMSEDPIYLDPLVPGGGFVPPGPDYVPPALRPGGDNPIPDVPPPFRFDPSSPTGYIGPAPPGVDPVTGRPYPTAPPNPDVVDPNTGEIVSSLGGGFYSSGGEFAAPDPGSSQNLLLVGAAVFVSWLVLSSA